MNRWLMKAILDLTAYLRLEAPIPDDMASEYLDIIEPDLENLTVEERAEFARFIEGVLVTERGAERRDEARIYFLEHLPESLGLVKPNPQLYFVRHLRNDESGFRSDHQYEIQILDAHLRGRLHGYIGAADTELTVDADVVPPPVIDAARQLSEGQSEYVNEAGEIVNPMWRIAREAYPK